MKRTVDEKIKIAQSFAYNFETYKQTAEHHKISANTVSKYVSWFLEEKPVSDKYNNEQIQRISNALKRKLDKTRLKINVALSFAKDFNTLDEYSRYTQRCTKKFIAPSTAGTYLHWFIENIIYLPGYPKSKLDNMCSIIQRKVIKNVKDGYGESTLKVKASYANSNNIREENKQKAAKLFIYLQSEYIENKKFDEEKVKELASLLFITIEEAKSLLISKLQRTKSNK